MSLAEQWCLGERRSRIGRPGATCTYATADWLSAVDREYKKADATVMSSIGLGGLGRRTDRPELIDDYSKPNSFPVPRSPVSEFHGPGPGFQSEFHGPSFRVPRCKFYSPGPSRGPQFPSSTVPVPVSRSPVSQFFNYVYETIGYSILTGTKTDAYISSLVIYLFQRR